jgi:hypothetical protein
MANRSILWRTTLALSLLTLIPNIHADPVAIRTDRLSAKQLRVWNSIREIVFAKDRANRLLHPRLHGLWQSVESSGHLIFVELRKHAKNASSKAGEMVIEKVDPGGGRHIVCVRLFLSTIDRSFAEKRPPQCVEQFAPFAGLSRKARYAEVLGHEFAHVERLLGDPDYLSLYMELDRELSSYCSGRNNQNGQDWEHEAQKQLERIDFLVTEVEKPAVAAEAEIWRELVAANRARMGLHP